MEEYIEGLVKLIWLLKNWLKHLETPKKYIYTESLQISLYGVSGILRHVSVYKCFQHLFWTFEALLKDSHKLPSSKLRNWNSNMAWIIESLDSSRPNWKSINLQRYAKLQEHCTYSLNNWYAGLRIQYMINCAWRKH